MKNEEYKFPNVGDGKLSILYYILHSTFFILHLYNKN